MDRFSRFYEVVDVVGESELCELMVAQLVDHPESRALVQLLRPGPSSSDGLTQAFRRSANLLMQVQHPNVVAPYDLGTLSDGRVYVTSPAVEGQDLETLLRERGPLTPLEVRDLMRSLCAGLAAAAARNLFHGNINARTVMVEPSPAGLLVRLAWFDLLRAHGSRVAAEADVRALGRLMIELVTGVVPLLPKDGCPALPEDLAELTPIVRRCLSDVGGPRFASVFEVAQALEQVQMLELSITEELPFDFKLPTLDVPPPPREVTRPASAETVQRWNSLAEAAAYPEATAASESP
jgi:serine/threonine-protein kinase